MSKHRSIVGTLTVGVILLSHVVPYSGQPAAAQTPPVDPIAVSTFDTDDEDWTVLGDAQGGSPTPNYFSAGGNPGGYVAAVDDSLDDVWYWRAPAKFLGDVSAAYGRDLAFDLQQSDTSNQFNAPDIVLTGNGITLVFDTPYNPETTWTTYSVPLRETNGWRNLATGQPATQSEMVLVLSALSDLHIRGEFRGEADVGGLDNVVFGRQRVEVYLPIVSR